MHKINLKKKHLVLGIMSGTSLDGIDYALCEISASKIVLKKMWSHKFTPELYKKISAAANGDLKSYEVAQLHHDLGRYYAAKAPNVKCDYVGLHGQTIFHNPSKKNPATFQIGEPSYLAMKFKVPVISQFRNMDLAVGGQGAPLATLFHKKVFGLKNKIVAVNNIGGISNVTYLPKQTDSKTKVMAFDTGPGNMLIDKAMQHFSKNKKFYDESGDMAARGISNLYLVEKWISATKYISEKPPKSTGRELFGEKYFQKMLNDCKNRGLNPFDTIATITLFTVESIVENYLTVFDKRMPDRIVICGGGAKNNTLMGMLKFRMRSVQSQMEILTSDELGWPSHSIEAAAFALLAYHTMNDVPGNIPEATGAKRAVILGQVTV